MFGNHRLAPAEAHLRFETNTGPIALSILGAAAIGVALPVSPILTGALVGFVVLLAVVVRFGSLGIAVPLTATLPWLITLSEVLPRFTVTFTAGATAVFIALVAMPRSDGSRASFLLRLGMVLFFAPVLLSLARATFDTAFIQAAKLIVFPLMVMVVAEATNRRDLVRLRTIAFWSSAVALTVNLLIGLSGVANIEYYGSGEVLGYGSAHTLALLAGLVVAAGLGSRLSPTSASVVGIAAIAAVATGVRSGLAGLALVTIARVVSGRHRFRVLALVALAVVGIFASGAADVVEGRFRQGQVRGEFQSFSSVGSGRGAVYSAAIEGWWASSPANWVVGTGLRSIGRFSEEELGQAFVGHSDVIEVGVQLGIIGLLGLILIWWVLIERAGSRLPLFVLGSFALFDVLLEFSGAVVLGLILAAGLEARGGARNDQALEMARVRRLGSA